MIRLGKEIPESGSDLELARSAYECVLRHLRYDKSVEGWGRGDAVWACMSGAGNCSDFHSLFLSLVRSRQIPARFEIGFPIPTARGAGQIAGYHCWARFFDEALGWIPVDISEADKHPELAGYYFGNLTCDRVLFSTGRDLVLHPGPRDGPINFLIYPIAERDGQPIPADRVRWKITYEDVDAR